MGRQKWDRIGSDSPGTGGFEPSIAIPKYSRMSCVWGTGVDPPAIV